MCREATESPAVVQGGRNGGGEWWWGCAEGVSRVFTVVDQVRALKNLREFPLQTPKQRNQSILNGPNLRTGDGSFIPGFFDLSLGCGTPGHISGVKGGKKNVSGHNRC